MNPDPLIPILDEVRRFLEGLKRDLPEAFCAPRPEEELLWDRRREQAGRIFSERTAHWSREMGVSFRTIRIKDQRTLWGSCSRQGNLNFNWRVVMAPPEVLDYLVIHELAHLLEMNHSRRFWDHVARWCPEHRERRRWLKEHGPGLQSRLRPAARTRFF